MDLILVLSVVPVASPFFLPWLEKLGLPPTSNPIILFVCILLLLWILSEFLLGGRSPGRFVLGLTPLDKEGKQLSIRAKLRRATGKISTLGMTGLNPFMPARYDTKAGVVWHSPIAPAKARPIDEWRITFRNGSLKSKSSRLGAIPAFKHRGEIRFGRDKNWADVVLGQADRSVSGQHCSLIVKDAKLYICDGNGAGKPSSRGTVLGNRPLKPGEFLPVQSTQSIKLGDVLVEISG